MRKEYTIEDSIGGESFQGKRSDKKQKKEKGVEIISGIFVKEENQKFFMGYEEWHGIIWHKISEKLYEELKNKKNYYEK
jgi:hypothetical protein